MRGGQICLRSTPSPSPIPRSSLLLDHYIFQCCLGPSLATLFLIGSYREHDAGIRRRWEHTLPAAVTLHKAQNDTHSQKAAHQGGKSKLG